MGILPYKVLCNAGLCVFHVFLLKVALSNVLDPDIEMKGKSGAEPVLTGTEVVHFTPCYELIFSCHYKQLLSTDIQYASLFP